MDKSEKGRLKKSAGRKDEEKQSRRRPHKEEEEVKKLVKEKRREEIKLMLDVLKIQTERQTQAVRRWLKTWRHTSAAPPAASIHCSHAA